MAREAQPQKTVFVCTGRNLPNESHETESISGQTNFIPTYCPINVPKTNQKTDAPRYPIIIFLSGSGVSRFSFVFFFSSTRGLSGSCVTFEIIPLLSA